MTPDCYETIRKTIQSLRAQTVRDRLEIVIVAPSKETLGLVDKEMADFHSVSVIEFGEIKTLGAPRAAAVCGAHSPLVALGEDHAFPEPTWAEVLIEAHQQPWAAVGTVMCNGNPGLLSWMSLVMDYGRWIEPVATGVTDDVPGHSSAWKRSLLVEYGPRLELMMQAPTLMHWDLLAKGHQLYLQPAARVRHLNITRLSPFVLDHLFGAQVFAAARASSWSWIRRLLYVGGVPILMIRTLREWLGHFRRTGLSAQFLPKAWPLLLLSIAVWGLGEAAGYAFGMGPAERRTLKYDARRGPYLSRRDRELLTTQ